MHRSFHFTATLACLPLAFSCASSTTTLDEPSPPSTQGVYGYVRTISDVVPNDGYHPLIGTVCAQAADATALDREATCVMTDDQGNYTLTLEAGTYRICGSYGGCDRCAVTVSSGAAVRKDYVLTEGPGWLTSSVDVACRPWGS